MSENKKQRKTSAKKKPLTHGWIVVPSKTYPDRVYFYNTVTNCSTWTNPCEDLSTSEQSSSESSSPKKKKSGGYKSRSLSSRKSSKKYFDSEERNIERNNEIEDYDEDQDQYFNNLVSSNSPTVSPISSPILEVVSKRDSEPRPSNCNLTSKEEKKELWLQFATSPENFKKSVAMSDFNPPSTSQKATGKEKSLEKERLSPRSRFSVYEQTSKNDSEKVNSGGKRKKKYKRTYSFSEDYRKTEVKEINNVSFKKRDKTPAQTRLLKLRQGNAEMLKKLAENHSSVQNLHANEPHTPSTSRHPSIENINNKSDRINNNSIQKDSDFDEEMDWEPSSEELDVQSINEFRQKRDNEKQNSNDTFFELTSDKLPTLPTESDTWLLVLDTNIFVSCLSFVKELRDTNVPELGYPILYTPWTVLKELDHLKDTNFDSKDRPLNYNIRRSINYLNENFKSGHPRCFGQPFEQFAAMVDGEDNAPDDEILQTCIQLQKLYPNKKLTLLTNDKNLESKAIVSKVEAYSKEGLQKKYLSSCFAPTRNGMTKCPSVDVYQLDNAVCGVKNLLKTLIPEIVETEMKEAFQGDWIKLAYKKPPWTLQDAMDCLIRHWRSVFFLVFPKEALFEIENLYQKLFNKEAASLEEIYDLRNTILKIINLFEKSQDRNKSYTETLETTKIKLLDLLGELSSKKTDSGTTSRDSSNNTPKECSSIAQGTSTENDVLLAKNLFKEIWDALKSFCCLVSDVLSSCSTNNNVSVPEIRLKLTQVLSEMNELLSITDELFKVSVKDITEKHPLIFHLSYFLIKICPAMGEEVGERLPVSLAAFLTDSEGRSLLSRSLVDFREFSQDLIKANEFFEKTYPSF